MERKQIFSNLALIGDNLELKENVVLKINEQGRILKITHDDDAYKEGHNKQNKLEIMIPGFINSHVHIGDSFAKEAGFNKNLKEIVAPPDGLKHKLLHAVSKESKIKGIKNAALEMLSNGTTCFVDFRERGNEGIEILRQALSDNLLNHVILGRFNDVDEIFSVMNSADGIGLASYGVINDQKKKILKEQKHKTNKIIACHVGERVREKKVLKQIIKDKIVDVIIHGTQ
ncbi:MAG: hypothetical protein EU539_07675, partial [Promethearchaeota archaeon]